MSRPDLVRLREDIERTDGALIRLIADRMRLAREVGVTKRDAALPTLDPVRETAVVRHAVELARKAGVPYDDEIRQIFWQLIALCRRAQADDA